jgi:hypothetical protein
MRDRVCVCVYVRACVCMYVCMYICVCTKHIRKVGIVCEYFRRSADVVISCMRAVFPHSLASHRRQYEESG